MPIMSCALHMKYPGSITGYISRKLTVSQILGCDNQQKFKCKLATKNVCLLMNDQDEEIHTMIYVL